jgi:hypothetical protein
MNANQKKAPIVTLGPITDKRAALRSLQSAHNGTVAVRTREV